MYISIESRNVATDQQPNTTSGASTNYIGRKLLKNGFTGLIILALTSCISVPPEASALSEKLGSRLTDIESAHINLVHDFFNEKRVRVDDYINAVWVPTFSREFFDNKKNQDMWNTVSRSNNPADRVLFLTIVGPELQKNINEQRSALVAPLEKIEREVTRQLRTDYSETRAINQSLTAYLRSASEVDENRQRYLDMIGFTEEKFNSYIDQAEIAVTTLVENTDLIHDHAKGVVSYREALQKLFAEMVQR